MAEVLCTPGHNLRQAGLLHTSTGGPPGSRTLPAGLKVGQVTLCQYAP